MRNPCRTCLHFRICYERRGKCKEYITRKEVQKQIEHINQAYRAEAARNQSGVQEAPETSDGTGRYIKVLETVYKPPKTYEFPPEDPERRKRIVEAQKRAIAEKKAKEQAETEKPKRKPRQNRVWTPEMIARFKELYAQGLTYPQIAAAMGMKRTQINAEAYYLKEQGEIDSRLPCNAWSDEEVELLHKLRKQGYSVARCAKKLHRSTGSVEARLRREAEKC